MSEVDLTDHGGNDDVLALRHMGKGIAHPMNPAPLPCGAEHAGDRMPQILQDRW